MIKGLSSQEIKKVTVVQADQSIEVAIRECFMRNSQPEVET